MRIASRLSIVLLSASALCAAAAARDKAADSLAGLRLEVPCANPKFNADTECHWDKSLLQTADPHWKLKREIVRKFGGNTRTTYDVTLHVRGVVEPKNFTGGEIQHEHFQAGGEAVKNDYNFYSLVVSNPAASYVVNRNAEKVGHYTFAIDYEVTIPMRGGATVTMGAYDSNDVAIANHEHHVVAGVPPAPHIFDGQFFDVRVEKIERSN